MTAKFKAGETAGTYIADTPLTEDDILAMARQLACHRLRKGQALQLDALPLPTKKSLEARERHG